MKLLEPDEILEKVHIGDFVALKIMQYHEDLPQIGKVVEITESSVSVDWLVGSYSSTFSFWKEKGTVIREIFPLRGIVCPLKLTSAMKLTKDDIKTLKELYLAAEFV